MDLVTEPGAVGQDHQPMDWEGFFRSFREPDFVPGYQILNKLGGGVFGDVYKARKTSIGKFYAIKFLKVLDEQMRDDVLRELKSVEAFAQLDHPNLVSIEDKGEVKGIPYIVMSYAGDETLRTRLSQAPLRAVDACAVFRQILQGVAALHERSIIHFDLKPANVFLKGDVARVGDYGLSKLVTQSARTLSMGRGTPAYMAPEMLQRKGDARSDVYSLGAMFFEMLAGRTLFEGDSEWEVLRKHETAPVVFPDLVAEAVRPFLRQALDKDPERRFRDAAVMLRAFDAATTGAPEVPPVMAAPPIGGGGTSGGIGERISAAVGRKVAHAEATVANVGQKIQEIWEVVRDETDRAVGSAKDAYRRGRPSQGAPPDLSRPTPPPMPRRRSWFGRTVTAPFRLTRWVFSNFVTVVVTCAVAAALMVAVEVVLEELIR